MSFKLFIYYCAICGGWAAFLTWAFVGLSQVNSLSSPVLKTGIIAALLGAMLAGAIGMIDGLLNSVGTERFGRAAVSATLGLFGGMLCGLIAEAIRQRLIRATGLEEAKMPRFPGWIMVGVVT